MRFKGISVIIFVGAVWCSSSCKIDKSFNLRNESVSLQGSQPSLWTKPGVGSSAACASDCGRDDKCLAFFYNPQEDICTAYSGLISLGHLTSGQDMYYSVDSWDCSDVLKLSPAAGNGVYTVNLGGRELVDVYCDMDTDGGGWTLFQRRKNGNTNFVMDWATYKKGFGNLDGSFWLGNDNIHLLTNERSMQLMIDMIDQDDQSGFATYSTFRVDDESSNYKLTVYGYQGDRGDSFSGHNGMMFSTKDRDNDASTGACAVWYPGGWWYYDCHAAFLNGVYGDVGYGRGINWAIWHGVEYSLKFTIMKVRQF